MSDADLTFALVTFSAVFFVVDPFAAVPIFLAITRGDDAARRRRTALVASIAAFVILALFALAGGVIFRMFGISLGAFKIAGGLMLLLMALDMMRAVPSRTRTSKEEEEESVAKEDVAIVPLAIPMLAGPGAIATVMVLMSRAAWQPVRTGAVLASIVITCAATWLMLRGAASMERFLKKTVLHVFERIMGLLLAAVAFEFIIGGVKDLMPGLR
jgi:multiple antibiotic resistance protein